MYTYNNPTVYSDSLRTDVEFIQSISNGLNDFFRGLVNNFKFVGNSEKKIVPETFILSVTNMNEFESYNLGDGMYHYIVDNNHVVDASRHFRNVTIGYCKVYGINMQVDTDCIHARVGYSCGSTMVVFTPSIAYGIVDGMNDPKNDSGEFIDVSMSSIVGVEYCYFRPDTKVMLVTLSPNIAVGSRYNHYFCDKRWIILSKATV